MKKTLLGLALLTALRTTAPACLREQRIVDRPRTSCKRSGAAAARRAAKQKRKAKR